VTSIEDEQLGRIVRAAWVAWAKEQPAPKPSWLIPWEQLDAGQREVDIRIGQAVAAQAAYSERARIRSLLPYNVNCCEGFPAAVADLIGEHEDSPMLPDDGTATPEIPQPTFTHRAYGVDVEWFGDEGGMIARSHVPDLRFIAACNHMARTEGKLRNVWDDPSTSLDDALVYVTRCWGLSIDPAESSDPGSDWALRYDQTITEQTPGAIAITVLAP
jgi:hypothetical protein